MWYFHSYQNWCVQLLSVWPVHAVLSHLSGLVCTVVKCLTSTCGIFTVIRTGVWCSTHSAVAKCLTQHRLYSWQVYGRTQMLWMNELMIYLFFVAHKKTSTQNLACLQRQIHTVRACKLLQAKTTKRHNRARTAPTHQPLPKVQLYCYVSDQYMWYFYSCEVSKPV